MRGHFSPNIETVFTNIAVGKTNINLIWPVTIDRTTVFITNNGAFAYFGSWKQFS